MPFLGSLAAASVNGYSSSGGSAYEVLNFVATGTISIIGNGTSNVSIAKTSGGSSWDSHAYVGTPFTAPITLEFNKLAGVGDNGASYAMISLNDDPLSDASYTSLDYAAYPFDQNNYYIYHNGSGSSAGVGWNSALKFYIVYRTDGQLIHYNGSNILYNVNYGTGRTVYIDSSFYSVNETFSRFFNVRAIRKVWNGTTYV
jgi:hypothetical protein